MSEKEGLIFNEKKLTPDIIMIVEKVYQDLKQIVGDKKLNTTNIVSITINLMQIVEKYPKLDGQNKKNIVIYVLKEFTKDYITDTDTQCSLLLFIETFLPSIIDSLVSVDKKEITINITKGLKSCFSC